MSDNNMVFRPVVGKDADIIKIQNPPAGHVWFATDSKKIYYSDGSQFLPMGGSSSIFYGNKIFNDPALSKFIFTRNDLEKKENNQQSELPAVDDLILNIPDGCFYRTIDIQEVDEEVQIICSRLTISGGGASNEKIGNSEIKLRTPYSQTILLGSECYLEFEVSAVNYNDISTGDGTYEIKIGTTTLKGVAKQNHINRVPISEYLINGDNTVKLYTYMDIGGSAPQIRGTSVIITVEKVVIDNWANEETELLYTDTGLDLKWKISGKSFKKTTYLKIDNSEIHNCGTSTSNTFQERHINLSHLSHGAHTFELYAGVEIEGKDELEYCPSIKKVFFVKDRNISDPMVAVQLFDIDFKQYNLYTLSAWVYDENNSKLFDLIFYENDIEVGREEGVENFAVQNFTYTPLQTGTQKLSFTYNNTTVNYLINVADTGVVIAPTADAAFTFNAKTLTNEQAVKQWNDNGVTLTPSANFDWINGGLKQETNSETDEKFQFLRIKANSSIEFNYPIFASEASTFGKLIKIIFRTTNCRDYDAIFGKCENKQILPQISNNVTPLILNFTESYKYKIGTGVGINNGQLELKDFGEYSFTQDGFQGEEDDERNLIDDKYLELDGKIYYCTVEYEAKEQKYYVLIAEVTINQDGFVGLRLGAQSATFNAPLGESLTTLYCEDHWIELEIEILPKSNNRPYIKTWIDGIPSDYIVYSNLTMFNLGDLHLKFGSSDCDTDIYMVKVYNKDLSVNEHMNNFIADAPYPSDIVARFNRNNIMSDENIMGKEDFDIAQLSLRNPDCLIHAYEIDRMTQNKKDPIEDCFYWQYHNSKEPILSATDVTIKVQGTSSEKYVLAAANLDSDFTNGFKDELTQEKLDGWKMNPDSIPVNFFCTKVNVASCENANNALNQELYHLFQPYKSVLRCKQQALGKARDTMEFTNGVLFIRDKNNETSNMGASAIENNIFKEDSDYMAIAPKQRPFKFYSIANMGNSKDNIDVLHDRENPYEFCIEVTDNQTLQQKMISKDYNDSDVDDNAKYYEFRYPDGKDGLETDLNKFKDRSPLTGKEVNQQQFALDAWRRFITWMAESNPQPKYNKHSNIDSLEKFDKIAKNPNTGSDVDVFVLNESSNSYDKVDSYQEGCLDYYTETEHINGYTNLVLPAEVTKRDYGNYKFNGYIANPEIQAKYVPLIKDCEITEYNYQNFINHPTRQIADENGFTHDTYEYRMAKMLHECENYLVMDSVIYHYLFIERHCMIDNVAKNTFWSTEDGYHWNLIKNYDNDTADGNDNQGKFTRYYGLEAMDKIDNVRYAFNAHESVWFNFIHGLTGACQHMYNKLDKVEMTYQNRKIKLWNKDDYLWLFQQWQSRIPERCWIEDYYRKYFRPYEVYGNNMFNSMLAGGQKKYQRACFETYESIYDDSKYHGSANAAEYLILRSNGTNMKGTLLPVKTYCDCYLRFDVGSSTFTKRVKRNTIDNFECPVANLSNATAYLYPASVFSELGSADNTINKWNPEQVSFSSAKKLRKLFIGYGDDDSNTTLKNGLALSNCTLLEELYVANLEKFTEGLNLSPQDQEIRDHENKIISKLYTEGCQQLKILDATNSSFTSINLPGNIPLTTLKLEAPRGVELSYLRHVNTFSMKQNQLVSLNLNDIDYGKLSSLALTKSMIGDKSADNLKFTTYKLLNVNWNCSAAVECVNGDHINTLDKLKQCGTFENKFNDSGREEHKNSLSGHLILDMANTTGINVLNIYNEYCVSENYPYLDIDFINTDQKLYKVNIKNALNDTIWSRKIDSSIPLDESFYSDGPNGQFIMQEMTETADTIYTFMHKWNVYNADTGTLITTWNDENNKPIAPENFRATCDIDIKPVYKTTVKKYTIIIKANNQELLNKSYEYETPLSEVINDLTIVPYKDDSELSLKRTYRLKGYHPLENSNTVIDLQQAKVQANATYYAIFEEIGVYDTKVIHGDDWFTFADVTFKDPETQTPTEGVAITGAKKPLHGKITLPKSYNSKRVIGIAPNAFKNNTTITHVFIEGGNDGGISNLLYVGEYAFAGNPDATSKIINKIQYFDFVPSLRLIDSYAFQYSSLKPNYRDNTAYYFGDNTYQIGFGAFNQLQTPTDLKCSLIISGVTAVIKCRAFSYAVFEGNGELSIEIGSTDNRSQLDFSRSGVSTSTNQNITTYNPIIQFNYDTITDITFYSDKYEGNWDKPVISRSDGGAQMSLTLYQWVGGDWTKSGNYTRQLDGNDGSVDDSK